ncbi:MAG TPA: hypothetical protein VFX12_00320 [Vicinamibacterales bacterium]|nr:hypothetical protein [Vicinamibacterales bacterium]
MTSGGIATLLSLIFPGGVVWSSVIYAPTTWPPTLKEGEHMVARIAIDDSTGRRSFEWIHHPKPSPTAITPGQAIGDGVGCGSRTREVTVDPEPEPNPEPPNPEP